MTFLVTAYLTDRAYGGPEEGGWYFDYGTPEIRIARVRTLKRARAIARRWNDRKAPRVNRDRHEPSSVLSDGHYRAFVDAGKPRPYPDRRPHYC